MHTCLKFVPDRSSCLASFSHFGMCDPLIPSKCPLGLDMLICLAYAHSLIHLYTCAKCDPDRSSGLEAFPDLLIDNPLNPQCRSGINRPLSRRLDRCDRVIHNETGDPNGGNMCSFSGATCTSRVRHNADYVPYAKIRFDL